MTPEPKKKDEEKKVLTLKELSTTVDVLIGMLAEERSGARELADQLAKAQRIDWSQRSADADAFGESQNIALRGTNEELTIKLSEERAMTNELKRRLETNVSDEVASLRSENEGLKAQNKIAWTGMRTEVAQNYARTQLIDQIKSLEARLALATERRPGTKRAPVSKSAQPKQKAKR